MNKILRNSLIGGGVAVALVVAIPFVVPLDTYRGRIETAAASATGRAFKIDGPLRLTFFPRFGVRAKDVTLANVPGGRASAIVAVGDIDLSLKLLPLFTGHVALDKIVLNQPTIALEVDKTGNPNWKFGKKTATDKGETKKGTLTLPAGTEFSGIEISDGRVTYDNSKTSTHRALEHVNVSVAITTANAPIGANGDVTLTGKKLTFAAKLATLKTFLGAGSTAFELSTDADLLHATIKGTLAPDGTTNGQLSLMSSSFRGLTAWLGTPLPGGGLNGLTLSALIANKDKVTRFENLNVSLDGQTMTGHLMVDARAKVPYLDGDLTVDRLDVNPYLASGKTGEPAQPGPAGWSRKPISVALIKEFNGRLALTTGSVHARGLHLGRTALHIETESGLLHVFLDQVSLYGGSGKGELTIDARGTIPQFANTVQIAGVQLKPLLTDALGLDKIEGVGAMNLDIRMAGASPDAILHSVSGKGTITGANGRFRGVDLGAVARSVMTVLGGNATGEVAATAFNDMGAHFALANGVMTTSDFHLAGPVVQMTGKGAIDIGGKTIDFRIRPQTNVGGLGIGVPFHITGTWEKLHYGPDVAGIVGGVMDSLQNGGSALGGLLAPKPQASDNGAEKGKKKKLGDQLKNMFGIH